jgi:molybdenum cofactor guanylyltransferase
VTEPARAAQSPRLSAVVLCGGASRRMGRDKALLPLEGMPLIARVTARVGQAAEPVVLAPGMPGRFAHLGLQEVEDDPRGIGPLGGLIGGLEASPHVLMAAVAVDLPFASPEVLSLLARLRRGEDAVVPVTASGTHPLHAIYAKTALPRLRTAARSRRYALRTVLDELDVRFVPEQEWAVADPTGRFALNLNRPEDLIRLGYPG